MNKQIYAALSLICGLLGFNLIAIVQTMSYMQVKSYQRIGENFDISIFSVGSFYKYSAIILGLLAILLFLLYKKSGDQEARLFSYIGLILGFMSLFLGFVETWLWFI